jgi:hypothetical protein
MRRACRALSIAKRIMAAMIQAFSATVAARHCMEDLALKTVIGKKGQLAIFIIRSGAHLRWICEFEIFPEYRSRHVTSRGASTRRRVSRRHLNFYRPQAPKNSELTPRLRRIKQKLASTQAPFLTVQDTHRSASTSIISSTTLSSFICRNCVEHGASQSRVERL